MTWLPVFAEDEMTWLPCHKKPIKTTYNPPKSPIFAPDFHTSRVRRSTPTELVSYATVVEMM